ncbi:MAG: FGGY family carbohydrate kinase [Gammaproteobacteria bacterium]
MSNSIYLRDRLYLAIDQGGHASRALVFNVQGEVVCQAHCDIHARQPAPGFVEYDAEALLHSIETLVQDIAAQLGERRRHVYAAGLATQRSNCLCWHRQTGAALTPIISWQDTRNADWLVGLQAERDDIHKRSGLFLSPHYGASKIRWCLDHVPEVQAAQQQGQLVYGPMAAYLAQRLTGQVARADAVNASRTQLVNLDSGQWDPALLELFGLDARCLPECVPNQARFGQLRLDGHVVDLNCVTGDQSAALFSYGRLQPDTAYVNIGTGAFVSRPSGYAKRYNRRLLTSVIHQFDNHDCLYALEGTINGAGSALQWLIEEEGIADLFTHLPQWLNDETAPPLFLNGVSGLAAPFWQGQFTSEFIGAANSAQKAVAVVESIVFLINSNIEEMQKTASPPQQIQVTGGLGRLEGLCQRLADVTALPVYRPEECEATARGLAYLLAGQPAPWPEASPGQWFEPAANPTLRARYTAWLDTLQQRLRQPATASL